MTAQEHFSDKQATPSSNSDPAMVAHSRRWTLSSPGNSRKKINPNPLRNFLTTCARIPWLTHATTTAAASAAAFAFFTPESRADILVNGSSIGPTATWTLPMRSSIVTVSGNNSVLTYGTNTGTDVPYIGEGTAPGTLILQDGGQLYINNNTQEIIVGRSTGALGTLIIGSASGTEGPGYITGNATSSVVRGYNTAGGSTLLFNYVGDSYYFRRNGTSNGGVLLVTGTMNIIHDSEGTTYLAPGAHSYSGTTDINSGTFVMLGTKSGTGATTIAPDATLQVGAGGATGAWAGPILNNGSLIFSRGSGGVTNSSAITGIGNVFINKTSSTDTFTFNGSITAHSLNISSVGTLSVRNVIVDELILNSSAKTTLAVSTTVSDELRINSSQQTTIDRLGGTADLFKSGSGTTVVTAGGTTGDIRINGGILHLITPTATGGTYAPSSIYIGAGSKLQIGKGSTGNSFTLASPISGPGSLEMRQYAGNNDPNRTLTLTGANTYSGGTVIHGALFLSGDGTLGTGPVTFTRYYGVDITGSSRLYLNYGAGNATLPNDFNGQKNQYGNIIKRGSGTVTLTGNIGAVRTITGIRVTEGELVIGDGGAPPIWKIKAWTEGNEWTGTWILAGASLVFNHDGYLYPYVIPGAVGVNAGHPQRTAFHGAGDVVNRGDGTTVIMGWNNSMDNLTGNWIVEHGRLQAGMGAERGTLANSTAKLYILGPDDGPDPLRADNPAYDINHKGYDGTFVIWRSNNLTTTGNGTVNSAIQPAIYGSGTFLKKGYNSVELKNGGTQFSGTYVVESGGLSLDYTSTTPIYTSYADFDLQRSSTTNKTVVKENGALNSLLTIEDLTITLAGDIYGKGILRKTSTGKVLTLLGNNTYAGGTYLEGTGQISVGNGGATGTIGAGGIVFKSGQKADLKFDRQGILKVPGNIIGGNTSDSYIYQTGGNPDPVTGLRTGVTILSGKSSYLGRVNITGGTLVLAGDNVGAVGANSRITVASNTPSSGTTLQIGDGGTGGLIKQNNTANTTTAAAETRLLFEGSLANGTSTVAINHADTVNWSRPLKGSATADTSGNYTAYNVSNQYSVFAQIGTGTTRLTNTTNTNYAGTIRVDNGRLAISSDNNLGTTSTSKNILNGGTLLLESNNTTFSRPWQLDAPNSGIEVPIVNGVSYTDTFSDAALLSGAGGFTKLGGGTLILAGATPNTFEDSVRVREGTLAVSDNAKLGANLAKKTNYLEGGTLRLGNGIYDSTWEVSSISKGVNRFEVLGSDTSTIGEIRTNGGKIHMVDPHASIYGTSVYDLYADGNFEKTGSGTLLVKNFSGFEGGVKISGGPLVFDTTALSVPYTLKGALSGTGDLGVSGIVGKTFQITKVAAGYTGAINLLGAGGILEFAPTGKMTLNSAISGPGQVQVSGPGALTLNGNVALTGAVINNFFVQGGTLRMGNNTISTDSTFGLSAGATLSGSGTITAAAFTSADSVISPGENLIGVGVGTLTINSPTTSSTFNNTTFKMNVGVTHDQINISGAGTQLSLANSRIELSNSGSDIWGTGGTQVLISATQGTGTAIGAVNFKGVDFGNFGVTSHITATTATTATTFAVTPQMSGNSAPVSSSTTNYTWAPGSGGFLNADRLRLGGTGTVTVAPQGVIAGELQVTGTGYTFTGGRIVSGIFETGSGGSSGSLILSNDATATFKNTGVDFESVQLAPGATITFPDATNESVVAKRWALQGGTVEFTGAVNYRLDAPVTNGGGTIRNAGIGTLVISAPLGVESSANTYTFHGTVESALNNAMYDVSVVSFDVVGGRTQILQSSAAYPSILGSEGARGRFEKIGEGKLVLDGATDSFGQFELKEGTLSLVDNSTYGMPLTGTGHNLYSGATLEFASTATYLTGWRLIGARPLISVPNGVNATLHGTFESLVDVSIASPLVKVGGGTLTLNGYGIYYGDTRIEEGKMVLAGRLSTGSAGSVSDFKKDVILSANTELILAIEPSYTGSYTTRNYQRFSGSITGDANGKGSITFESAAPGGTVDFYGKVDVPLIAKQGTLGGEGYLANLTINSASAPNLVISPGNNDGIHNAIGSLTIGRQDISPIVLNNVTLLVDVVGSSTSDTLYVTGNADWHNTNRVDVRTGFPLEDISWENGTYLIARANPGAYNVDGSGNITSVAFTERQANALKDTDILFNGVPVKNTRLQASLEFLKVLTATAANTATYGGTDTSAIVLHTEAGENQVLYWQGRDSTTPTSWKPLLPLNWRWYNIDANEARRIAFWDGDAVILGDRDGDNLAHAASDNHAAYQDTGTSLVTQKNIFVTSKNTNSVGVYVASMFLEGTDYNLDGELITGSTIHSRGAAIEETSAGEEYLWLTAGFTVRPTGSGTIANALDFYSINVQGTETPSAVSGGNLTLSGNVRVRSGELTIGRSARVTLAGNGTFEEVNSVTVGNGGVLAFDMPQGRTYSFDGVISNRIQSVNSDDDATAYEQGGLEKLGQGKVILTAENSYAGPTSILGGGTLEFRGHIGVHEYVISEYNGTGDNAGEITRSYVPNYAQQITINGGSTLILNPPDEQILSHAAPIIGTGFARKEGSGTLVIPANGNIPATIEFTHAAGTLAGTGTIQNIVFEPGAIVSPGELPFAYSVDGDAAYTRTGTVYNEDTGRFGNIHFGNATATTQFSGVRYVFDLNPESTTSDLIEVTGDTEFGLGVPNTIDLGPVTSLGNTAYTILTTTGTLTTANLPATVILYGGATSTATRSRAAVRVKPTNIKHLELITYENANLHITWTGLDQKSLPGTASNIWSLDPDLRNWREDEHIQYFKTNDVVTFPKTAELPAGAYVGSDPKEVTLVANVTVGEMNVDGPGYKFIGAHTITGTINGDGPQYTTLNVQATDSLKITPTGEATFENTSVNFDSIHVEGWAEFHKDTPAGRINITGTGSAPGIDVSGNGVLLLGMNSDPFETTTRNRNIAVSDSGAVLFFRTLTTGSQDYTGVISGTGGNGDTSDGPFAVAASNGAIVFTQNQNYSGATIVGSGASLTLHGTLGTTTETINGESSRVYTGNVYLRGDANLTFDLSATQTLSGNYIFGEGTLTKTSNSKLYVFNDGSPVAAVQPTFLLNQGTLAGDASFVNASFANGTTLAPYFNNPDAGLPGESTLGVLRFGSVELGGVAGRIGNNLTLDINLEQTSLSDRVVVTGDVKLDVVSALNVNATPDDFEGAWRTGRYVILEAAAITDYSGLTPVLIPNSGGDQRLTAGGITLSYASDALPVEPRYHAELILHHDTGTNKDQLILQTWIENRGIIWYGDATTRTAGADTWGEGATSSKNWDGYPGHAIDNASNLMSFFEGDHVLFLNNGAPQTVNVDGDSVTVYAMNIGNGANYTFTGGKILGDAESAIWKHDGLPGPDPDDGYTAIGGGLYVESGGTGTFNTALAFAKIGVWGTAAFNAETLASEGMTIYGPNGLAIVGPGGSLNQAADADGLMDITFNTSGGTLRFLNVGSPGYTHNGNISGPGNIEVRRTLANSGVVTLAGANTHTGMTSVADGTQLRVTGTFGPAGTGANSSRYTHTAPIVIDGGSARVSFENAAVTQVIGDAASAYPGLSPTTYGTLRGGASAAGSGGGLVVGSEGATPVAAHVVLAGHFNPYQGDLRVEGAGSTLEITGHVGVWQDKFDHGTPFAATYYHASYSGRIYVGAGASVDFATTSGGFGHADYQWIGGGASGVGEPANADGLTGRGTFIKSGPMPVYFAGRAGWFEGNTEIRNGLFQMPATRWGYNGNGSLTGGQNAGSFVVGSSGGATRAQLQLSGGGSLYASSMVVHSDSTLSVLPGRYEIVVPSTTGTVTIQPGAAIVVRIGEAELGRFGTESSAVAGGGKVVVSGGSATGALVIGNIAGGLPNVSLSLAQIPSFVPDDIGKVFNLFSGIDTSVVNAAGRADGEAFAAAVFGTNQLKFNGAGFTVYFKGGSVLMELTSLSATIPEPSTYGLCGGVLVLLGAMAFRRRRKMGAKAK